MDLIKKPEYGKNRNLLIVGAGVAGRLVSEIIIRNPSYNYNIVSFLDDDPAKIGKFYGNIPILGPIARVAEISAKLEVNEMLIALPSAPGSLIKNIFRECEKLKMDIKIMPSDYESQTALESGGAFFKPMREVKIEDFFRRKPAVFDYENLRNHYFGKTILVTGGAGSIGSELCSQLLEYSPKKLIILDNAETPLHETFLELKCKSNNNNLVPVLADIRDQKKLNFVFKNHRPDIVFHAAAYKHVPMMEYHPDEAIKTNIFGSKNILDVASMQNVKEFVMISTDKAVNPTSIMGTTKRITEMILQTKVKDVPQTTFFAVRFGNVINSQGSVVPLFEKQAKQGGPITVTHPEIKRFFMTIEEAVQLVIQSPILGESGNIFILDMGQLVKIKEIAEDIIRLNGFEPYKDIEISYTGLRPGEKLFEELSTNLENQKPTKNPRIFLVQTNHINGEMLNQGLNDLRIILEEGNTNSLISKLKEIVPNFSSPQIKMNP